MPTDSKTESLVKAGNVAKDIHKQVKNAVKPGVNLLDIEKLIADIIARAGMTPAFKGFNGYNAASCLSVNYEVVHSIPRSYRLAEGDILSVDFGVTCNGWMVDTARTYGVGKVSNKTQKLIDVTAQALDLALEQARVGKTTGDIGHVIQKCVEDEDFYIIRDLTGHGVGRTLQESPSIPNHGHAGGGVPLKEDMVLAIEPIVATVKCHIGILDDGWTIITDNGAEAAHFEDTVMVTSSGPKILTR